MSGDGFPYPVDRAGNFAATADEGLTAQLRQRSAGERTYVGDLMRKAAERLEDKTSSIRVEIAAKLAAYNDIKALEAERDAALVRIERLEEALKPFVAHADRYADWLRKAIAPNPSKEAFDAARSALAQQEASHV